MQSGMLAHKEAPQDRPSEDLRKLNESVQRLVEILLARKDGIQKASLIVPLLHPRQVANYGRHCAAPVGQKAV